MKSKRVCARCARLLKNKIAFAHTAQGFEKEKSPLRTLRKAR